MAAAAGVSKTLVSYALNGRPGVKESTREHILEVAKNMGWTASVRARSLSASRAFAIGLVFQTSPEALASDEYFTSVMAGLQSVLAESQYSLVTEVVGNAEEEEESYRRLIREGRVDGLVVTDPRPEDPRSALVDEYGLSWVTLGRPPAPSSMPYMIYDETKAIADAVAHLVELGHQRIAQVVGPQIFGAARIRRELYQQQLEAHGLDSSTWIESDFTAPGGRMATEELLDSAERPTAIVFSNDLMAIAGMSVAHSRGMSVPEDLSIVGWDDITVAQYLHPALTTVTQHPFEDGQTAARLLLEAIGGRRFDEAIVTRDPEFVCRESTGPAPS